MRLNVSSAAISAAIKEVQDRGDVPLMVFTLHVGQNGVVMDAWMDGKGIDVSTVAMLQRQIKEWWIHERRGGTEFTMILHDI